MPGVIDPSLTGSGSPTHTVSRLRCGDWARLVLVVSLVLLGGCRPFQKYGSLTSQPYPTDGAQQIANPLIVPMMDRWLVMDQVSDELDNYFKIYREERIRVLDGVMSEGWIETHPKLGSTLLEPWHRDSTPGFEKLHATLQTVRRFAKVRVIPTGDQYQIDVKVFKELEDLPQPLGASVGGRNLRYDGSMDIDQADPVLANINDGWIPMGRDYSLEQKILANLQSRLAKCLAN